MEPFTRLHAIAAPIDEPNLDTNQLCPTRFNKLPRDDPFYAKVLFHHQRFTPEGDEIPDFVLNREPFRRARILVADRNFGCGSSRETAVYALLAFGIRCVIASGFGDIHASNAMRNGLLPVVLPQEAVERLRAQLHASPGTEIEVDLAAQTVTGPGGETYRFEIHPTRKRCLLEGLDDIALTEEHRAAIDAFEARYRREAPWLYPPAGSGSPPRERREP